MDCEAEWEHLIMQILSQTTTYTVVTQLLLFITNELHLWHTDVFMYLSSLLTCACAMGKTSQEQR